MTLRYAGSAEAELWALGKAKVDLFFANQPCSPRWATDSMGSVELLKGI